MTFDEAMAYLYNRLPVFHAIGHRAYKPGLATTVAFCQHLQNPQNKFPCIHVGGTNGKGSVSNMLAAILQQAGYKTGLYTSPHLKHFTERIRVNGKPVPGNYIASFVANNREFIEQINPSFFEATVAMAFDYFAQEKVDIAVIEVGMGGRLDSTNVITPIVSVITNIGLDHTRQLGATLPLIAREKAGIIKENVPVIISERQEEEVMKVFENSAAEKTASLKVGTDYGTIVDERLQNGILSLTINKNTVGETPTVSTYRLDLAGNCQKKNILGVLATVDLLNELGWKLPLNTVASALAQVTTLTGFKGRWTMLGDRPFIVADTAHNHPGFKEALSQFLSVPADRRHFVLGYVNDKDIDSMLGLLPTDAQYYFCAPSNERALNSNTLRDLAGKKGLLGTAHANVNEALQAARSKALPEDSIYVGGSTFVVADIEDL